MAVQTTRALPAQFIEDLGQDYGKQLAALTQLPVSTGMFAPQVAAQDPLQTAAYQQATDPTTGLGAYQPFLTGTGAAGYAPGAAAMGETAGTTLGGVSPYIGAAGTQYAGAAGLTGAGANLAAAGQAPTAGSIADYMSPYQSQVIQTTLDEFDEQALRQKAQQAANALGTPGAFGGGREGVLQAQYATQSDRNRAALHAQMLQQGWQQGQRG